MAHIRLPDTLVFDIETVLDIALVRRRFGWQELSDADVHTAFHRQCANGFPSHPYHCIVAISAVLHTAEKVSIWSLGEETSSESALIQRFFEGLEKYIPVLVSWNGSGFDLPVLHYRALRHAIQAPRYWEMGEGDTGFKWNNYLNRFHFRHTDLMDVLAGYQSRAVAKLDLVADLLGFPGKIGMDGSQVWQAYQAGRLADIRAYCETDVLNTYLIYLAFEHMRGRLSTADWGTYQDRLRMVLSSAPDREHWKHFLVEWEEHSW